ncbi:MAG: hypothetical protein LBC55_02805 [Desulfovibrio sp.]|nr:hypothetical protein [Desulfovibrio sp.]
MEVPVPTSLFSRRRGRRRIVAFRGGPPSLERGVKPMVQCLRDVIAAVVADIIVLIVQRLLRRR